MSNETFCTDVSGCSSFECSDILCWDGYNLKPNLDQTLSVILYLVFRFSERIIFAYLAQINRELLQLTVKERRAVTTCCFYQGILPTGIYKQIVLRFLGTVIGVLSFILILERNILMFILLIVIDSFGVGLISWCQHKDAPNTQSELTKMDIPDDVGAKDSYEEWLNNRRKFLEESEKDSAVTDTNAETDTSRNPQRGLQRPLLKFL